VAGSGSPPPAAPPMAGYPPPYPPPPPPPPSGPHARNRSALGRLTVSAALLVAGVLAALAAADVYQPGPGTVLSAMLIVVGLGLLVGGWYGRSRGLIAAGVLLTLVLTAASAARVPEGGFGDRYWHPASAAALEPRYRLGAGQGTLDLNAVDPRGGTVPVRAEIGFGELRVLVPDDVRLVIHARANAGEVVLPDGFQNDGSPVLREHTVEPARQPSRGTLDLTLRVGMGEVEVSRATP
jgi:hypothetical protein